MERSQINFNINLNLEIQLKNLADARILYLSIKNCLINDNYLINEYKKLKLRNILDIDYIKNYWFPNLSVIEEELFDIVNLNNFEDPYLMSFYMSNIQDLNLFYLIFNWFENQYLSKSKLKIGNEYLNINDLWNYYNGLGNSKQSLRYTKYNIYKILEILN